MTTRQPPSGNAVAPRFDVEPFAVAAEPQLAAHPLARPGFCAYPGCSRPFNPTRPWQIYCCEACKTADMQEMRSVGLKATPALLAWRMGKHDSTRTPDGMVPTSAELRALSNAGRAYVSNLQSAWFFNRVERARAARGRVS